MFLQLGNSLNRPGSTYLCMLFQFVLYNQGMVFENSPHCLMHKSDVATHLQNIRLSFPCGPQLVNDLKDSGKSNFFLNGKSFKRFLRRLRLIINVFILAGRLRTFIHFSVEVNPNVKVLVVAFFFCLAFHVSYTFHE